MLSLKPDFVLIGNSMLYTRIHERTLAQALAPRRIIQIAYPGAASATWYLVLKNYVAAAPRARRRVLVFFRHFELTEPRMRTTGKYAARIASLQPEPDEVLKRKLSPGTSDPVGRARYELERLAPVERLRPPVLEPIQRWARRVSELFVHDADEADRSRGINEVFALGRLRSSVETPSETYHVDFKTAVPGSFLPEMLQLAKMKGFRLTFVRTRPREAAEGKPEMPELLAYLNDLASYLKENGSELVDMKSATWETADMYRDGDHLSTQYTRTYTRLFAEHMAHLFQ